MRTSLQDITNIQHTDIDPADFEIVKVYTEESHLIRRLLKHIPTGELYFYEFKEEIDYTNGNDPQYRTYIPVSSEKRADEINELNVFEILTISPRLINDWLADDTRITKWV